MLHNRTTVVGDGRFSNAQVSHFVMLIIMQMTDADIGVNQASVEMSFHLRI